METEALLEASKDIIKSVLLTLLPKWEIRESIEDYKIDMSDLINKQANFLSLIGGTKALYGQSDMGITKIVTSNYTMEMNTKGQSLDGIPLAPGLVSELKFRLRSNGIGVGVW